MPRQNKSIKLIDIDRTFNLKTHPHSDDPECSGLQSINDTSVVYVPHFLCRNAAEFEKKKCMSDNIRNKAIFEIKIAKIAQNLPKWTFCKFDPNVAQWKWFSGVSIFYSYRDLAWTKHKFKKWFFGQNFDCQTSTSCNTYIV